MKLMKLLLFTWSLITWCNPMFAQTNMTAPSNVKAALPVSNRPNIPKDQKTKFNFKLSDPKGQFNSVRVKGTFNNWNAASFELKKTEVVGANKIEFVWTGSWDLGRGVHQYVFVVDGKEIRDPNNSDSVGNGMGGFNSVIRNVVEDIRIQTLFEESQLVDVENKKLVFLKNGQIVSTKAVPKVLELTQLNSVVCLIEYSNPSSLTAYAEFKGRKQSCSILMGAAMTDFLKVHNYSLENKRGQMFVPTLNKDGNSGLISGDAQNTQSSKPTQQALLVIILERFGKYKQQVLDYSISTTGDLIAFVYNSKNKSDEILIPLNNGIIERSIKEHYDKKDPRTMVIYNPMIDRFYDGNPANNKPLLSDSVLQRVDYHGGDIKGLTKKIKEGYFKKLGINTIWISPVVLNPQDAWGQWNKPRTKFSGYHGYWPISSTQTDPRFCTPAELKEFIDVAHKNNIRVLMDYVAHHIHQNHPLYKQHPDWFTSLYLPDGSKNTEKWDEHRLTTWFDDFLPTFDFSKPEVVEAMSDSALFWLRNYDIDGFRHDATKHIPNEFWLALTKKIKKEFVPQGRNIYQIGETYGSPELIASYLGPQLLDAQFDFNLYDAAVASFKSDQANFAPLAETLSESKRWYGNHHTMGNITGNQDRPRFISLADASISEGENPKQAGWDRDIQVRSEEAYKKLQNLAAFMNFIPGVPVIYYGDEIGMPGANDPDSRRDMRFDYTVDGTTALTSPEKQTRNTISQLTSMRTGSMALTFGDCVVEVAETNKIVLKRRYFDEEWYFISMNGTEDELKAVYSSLGVTIPQGSQGTGVGSQDLITSKSADKTPTIMYMNTLKSGNFTAIIRVNR